MKYITKISCEFKDIEFSMNLKSDKEACEAFKNSIISFINTINADKENITKEILALSIKDVSNNDRIMNRLSKEKGNYDFLLYLQRCKNKSVDEIKNAIDFRDIPKDMVKIVENKMKNIVFDANFTNKRGDLLGFLYKNTIWFFVKDYDKEFKL